MKILIALLVSAFALSANALESHYGKITYRGGQYHCAYTNHGAPKDMKWVVFVSEGLRGDSHTREIRRKVDDVVGSGETIRASSGVASPYRHEWYCKFLERHGGASETPDEPTPN